MVTTHDKTTCIYVDLNLASHFYAHSFHYYSLKLFSDYLQGYSSLLLQQPDLIVFPILLRPSEKVSAVKNAFATHLQRNVFVYAYTHMFVHTYAPTHPPLHPTTHACTSILAHYGNVIYNLCQLLNETCRVKSQVSVGDRICMVQK